MRTLSILLVTAALFAAGPAVAQFSCGGDGPPCPPPPPAPKPDLPPAVMSYGYGSALIPSGDPAMAGQSFVIGENSGGYVTGSTTQSASTGTQGTQLYGTGLAEGATSLGPAASAQASTIASHGLNQTPIGALANIFLTYQVAIHAQDAAAASALFPYLSQSGALASVTGHATLDTGGSAYSAAIVTTGVGIFENASPFAGADAYGRLGSDFRLLGRTQLNCAPTSTGFGTPDISGCGTNVFTLPVNFISAADYEGGNALDFIGNVELRAFAAGSNGFASAFVDPMVTLAADLDPDLYTLTIGGGQVSNLLVAPTAGVPEPASWALLLTGFGLVGALRRRRRRPGAIAAIA